MLILHNPPLSAQLLKNTHLHDLKLRGPNPRGIGFSRDAEAATAAFFGDWSEAAKLFNQSWRNAWVEPYGMIKEARGEDYACFLTNFGSLLQTATVGFTGIRVTHPGWTKYPATLPEGWDRIEIERIWVRGEAKQLTAVNGKPAILTASSM